MITDHIRSAAVGEVIVDALSNLYAHRQRSALALLGIVIGTASVVAMLTIGHMAEREALRLFDRMGVDMLVVQTNSSGPTSPGLNVSAIESLPSGRMEIAQAAPLMTGELGGAAMGAPLAVAAVTPAVQSLAGLELQSGRFLASVDDQKLVAVVGAEADAKLSKPADPVRLGGSLRLGTYLFTVVGLLKESPSTAFDPTNFNDSVLIPLGNSRRAFGQIKINAAMARLRPGADAETATARLTAALHQASPGIQFQVQNARSLIATIKAQKAVHTRLLAAIGGISLLVGGIGVMNVMLMGVMERKREIGLRAAIGATPRDIQLMFLVEASVLSLIGGVVGALVGVMAAFVTAKASGWVFSLAVYPLPLGAGVATLVGLIFGLYPAVKASRLDPIEALRGE